MKLSFSNIAWSPEYDDQMYGFLTENGYIGLEIAPTRIFPDAPYEHLDEARAFAQILNGSYGLSIPSMQSIWFGRDENLFNTDQDRHVLTDYTNRAVDFASVIGCGNLVFGCPKNRIIPNNTDGLETYIDTAYAFFAEIASYAQVNGTAIALEANPTIYGTNFINRTSEAFAFAKKVKGLKVNVDCGTIIANQEGIGILADNIELINHIHISEPNLAAIEQRSLHQELSQLLSAAEYGRFVSVEMKNCNDLETVKNVAVYIAEVFG